MDLLLSIKINIPKPIWKPSYSVVVVTENEQTFVSLKSLSCPVLFITGEDDVRDLQNYELIQMIDSDKFEGIIESLPQAIKIAGLESVFPERYLMILSGWKENLALLKSSNLPEEVFVYSIPLGLDENELRKLIFFKESRKNSEASIKIQKASHILREIPEKLQNLADNLILSDFINGISSFMKRQEIFPKESEDICINNS